MSSARPRVALIRGSTLNPWEMQAFEPLRAEWDLRLVGSRGFRRPMHTVDLPVLRLPELGELAAAVPWAPLRWRLQRRVGVAYDQHRLLGLEFALRRAALVHTVDFHYAFSGQAARFCRDRGLPLVVTRWENIPFACWRFGLRPPLERYREVARAATVVVGTSLSALESLREEGTEVRASTVVYPGVDTERFRPGSADPGFLRELGIPEEARVLRFIGRITWEKGWLDLLGAFRRLVGEFPEAVLLLVGSGPEEPILQEALRGFDPPGRVRWISAVDYARLPDLHRVGGIFCLPSIPTAGWEEQFGMVLPEAMASGSAVVATRTGAIPEVVGDAGLLVTPHDGPALADALGRLLRDEPLRADLAARARERARSQFSRERFRREMAEVYRSVGV